MNLRTGQAWWLLDNGLLNNYPSLRGDARCTVAVLGGGITGALIADRLVRDGVDTLLLDKRDVGTGSTVASTSLLQYEIDVELAELIGRVGEAHAVRAYRLGLEAIDRIETMVGEMGVDCGFARRESLYFASRRSHRSRLKEEFECRRRHGFDVEYLEAEAVRERYGFDAPGAILSRGDAVIDAYQFTHALLSRAARGGLRIFDRTAVTKIEPTADGVTLTTDKHTVQAQQLVFATGYESQDYLKHSSGNLLCTFATVSEPMDALPAAMAKTLFWETARPYFYLRTTPDRRIIMGGEDTSHAADHKIEGLIEKKSARLVRRFQSLFPNLDYELAYAWAGTFGETKDGLAYIGATPEWPQCQFAMGYGGNGVTMSAIAAELLADACGGRENTDAAIYRFGR